MTNMPPPSIEAQLAAYVEIIARLQQGDYNLDLTPSQPDGVFQTLDQALQELAFSLELFAREQDRIDRIATNINAGLLLDDILEKVYDDFRELIPYNRIGLSLIEAGGETVFARWAKTDQSHVNIRRGYSAPLAGSSLQTIIDTGQPRILNDLERYLEQKPDSESTRLIVDEGILSSLTCPLITGGKPVGFLFFSSVRSNTYRDTHVATFQRIAGQLSMMIEKGRLVTELDERRRASEHQNDELKRVNEMKNVFLGIAAHDLRSPLGLIEMAMTFLLDPTMGATAEESAIVHRDILQQSRYMLDLINELLDVTQIESGQFHLKKDAIVAAEFMTETVERHCKIAATKNTTIQLDLAPDIGETIMADPARLRQVLDNLISNAVKYSPSGSQVVVRCKQAEGEWVLSVEDQGPGIRPEDRTRLFQAFTRLSARPTGGERSTGLGLTIARRVVEAHGGTIGVESVPGEGATFWFTLPA